MSHCYSCSYRDIMQVATKDDRQPQQKPAANGSLEQVKEIDSEVGLLEKEVNEFTGDGEDVKYRYLDEMLTRCMLKLDSIEHKGQNDVRAARRTALNRIDQCLNTLESKVKESKEGNERNGNSSS